MAYTLDNQTLLYIIIAFFVVQLLVMRYYVQTSIEESNHKNNKKVVKKLTGQISATFDQYMGQNRQAPPQQERGREDAPDRRRPARRDDMDSVEDPAEDVEEEEDPQEESDE